LNENIFAERKLELKLVSLTKITAIWLNANFIDENWPKSPKIMNTTLTPPSHRLFRWDLKKMGAAVLEFLVDAFLNAPIFSDLTLFSRAACQLRRQGCKTGQGLLE
jgi:hypothetical protein